MHVFASEKQSISDTHCPVLGAIDIGTNSCRLLVANVNIARLGRSFFSTRQNLKGWKILDSFARIVRLGEGLHETSQLSQLAIERTLEALYICRKKMDRFGVTRLRAVATEACRQAENGQELVDRALKDFGIKIDIISGEEEARLILTGCASLLNTNVRSAIVFDIGGGSTEAIWVTLCNKTKRRPGYPVPFQVLGAISLPYGVVTCTESLKGFGTPLELYQYVRSQVFYELQQFCQKHDIYSILEKEEVQLLGSSGTVTTLAAIQGGLSRYERRFVDKVLVETSDLRRVCQEIPRLSQEERLRHPCIGRGRSDLIVAGASILEGIFDAIPIPHVKIADRGVREGILSELLVSLHRHDNIFNPEPNMERYESSLQEFVPNEEDPLAFVD